MTSRPRLVFGTVAACGFLAVAVVLSLSDRAGLAFRAVSDATLRALDELERVTATDLLDRSDIPLAADQLAHVALWGVGMLVIGWFFRRRYSLVAIAAAVFGLSLAIEVGQQLFSFSRSAQVGDAGANLLGIVAATVVLAVVGRLVDRSQRLHHPARPQT